MNATESKDLWRLCNRLSDAMEEVQEVLSALMEFEGTHGPKVRQRVKKKQPVANRKRAALK